MERCGAWLEVAYGEDSQPERPGVLRGEIWDTAEGIGLGEWTRLSLEPPLPLERLAAGETVEFRDVGNPGNPSLARSWACGTESGRRLWQRGALRGVLLLAASER